MKVYGVNEHIFQEDMAVMLENAHYSILARILKSSEIECSKNGKDL